ncbi:DUF559 domain-containing protein [Novosphingobium flavum]|uniref:endonuclease domain-containing protein n=1 Tax=Novosphingobium aerophilum TaxID=2839843 RepID=UPI00163A89A4|nr:endonuclease domain-containing protein [Novosphingobium aerophilum]MBC2663276.1 DUF559 domain-containing protein [Novosphingobium aerophilum]
MITGPASTVKLARKLRSEMSVPERLLWGALRQRPGGYKFRRQHPAGVYVIDFYCPAVRLALEVDGFAHETGEVMNRDKAKSHHLRSQGVATLRMPAKAVLEDLSGAVERIVAVCAERAAKLAYRNEVPLHQPAAGPPPRSGEDT